MDLMTSRFLYDPVPADGFFDDPAPPKEDGSLQDLQQTMPAPTSFLQWTFPFFLEEACAKIISSIK
jgi:hypothetical protein